jgi:hypothetical protein
MIIRATFKWLFLVSLVVFAFSQRTLAADCVGNMPLTLTETQGGFAGTTGTVWKINPDCSFTISRLINAMVSDPHRRGQLTSEQQSKLTGLLAEKAANLPAKVGQPVQVNPHQLTLIAGGKTSVLDLPPGPGGLESVKGGAEDAAKRLVEIFEVVKELTGGA